MIRERYFSFKLRLSLYISFGIFFAPSRYQETGNLTPKKSFQQERVKG